MGETCRGRTKQGLPCSIAWGLDASGHCKYHAPNAAQCRGIARSTGRRCSIRWDLNADGFCGFHESQTPQRGRRCGAIAQSTGLRCQRTVGIDKDGFCASHRSRDGPPLRICRGFLLNSRAPCENEAKPGYAYCCAAHDTSKKHYAPSLFGDSRLRSEMERDVVARYDRRDLYHHDVLDLSTPGFLELDHIVEKQCYSYAFQFVDFRDEQEDVDFLATMLREEVVNELPNLCLTRATTNRIKGAAVWRYLDDCITGHVGYRGAATFVDYMLAENRDSVRLGRATTRTISSEMGTALKYCQRELAAQGETPLLESLSDQLQRLYVQMQLHGTSSVKTKPGNRSKTDVKAAKPTDSKGSSPPRPMPSLGKACKAKPVVVLNSAAKPFVPQTLAGTSASLDEVSSSASRRPVILNKAAGVKANEVEDPVIHPPSEKSETGDAVEVTSE